MRILHVITTIDRGGAEKQLLTLVSEQIRHGHQVDVFFLKGKKDLRDEFLTLNANVYGSKRFLFSCLLFFFFLLKNSKFSIIHAHLPAAEILSSLYHRRIPLVVSRHNTQRFIDSSPKISHFLAKLVQSQATLCIAISHAVRDFLLKTSEWTNKETLRVVYYGEYIDKTTSRNFIRLQPGLKLLFIGRLTEQKDVQTLLHAFSQSAKEAKDDTLTIIGEGELFNELQTLTQELGIESRVFWIGKVNDVNPYYLSHDVLVLPSKYEGFGLVLLEAMTQRIPVLAANNSAIPEVLGFGHEGLFTTGDSRALSHLMKRARDPGFLEKLVSEQEKRLYLFKPDVMYYAMQANYLDAIKVHAP